MITTKRAGDRRNMTIFGTVVGHGNFFFFFAWQFCGNIGRYTLLIHANFCICNYLQFENSSDIFCIVQHCRALVKAYAMNPVIHSLVHFFFIPGLIAFAIYKTSSLQLFQSLFLQHCCIAVKFQGHRKYLALRRHPCESGGNCRTTDLLDHLTCVKMLLTSCCT